MSDLNFWLVVALLGLTFGAAMTAANEADQANDAMQEILRIVKVHNGEQGS